MIKLDKRLGMIAGLVRKGSRLADIGTDHAYLAAYLVENEICCCAIAADINVGPLKNAEETIRACGLETKIKTVLSDGLLSLEENCADDIVLAGMGGELIASILSQVQWIKNKNIRIIAQPMTHSEDLRSFLTDNGFKIEKEAACQDSRHCYCAIVASFCGEKKGYSPSYMYYGELPKNKDESSKLFLINQLKRLEIKRCALEKAQKNQEASEIKTIIEEIKKELNK